MQAFSRTNIQHKILLVFFMFLGLSKVSAQQPNIIYVTPSGSGAGTQASPASLAAAIASAAPGKQIRLASGTYYLSNTLNMVSNLTIEGGYDPNGWCKNSNNRAIIYRDSANIDINPNRLVAISCNNISDFNIHDVDIITANAIGNGVTNYALYINSCTNYSVVRCNITSGNGSDGLNGLAGADGANGAAGTQGGAGDPDGSCCVGGGTGGNSWSAGAASGGNGGNGGNQGSFNSCPNATNGQGGTGSAPGAGGNGGLGSCNFISTGCDAGPANHGQPGIDGANGVNGNPGGPGTPGYGAGFFITGDGIPGQNGTDGSGGGGGGGGGSQGGQPSVNLWFVSFNYNGAGPGGGGGGEGGQGGIGAGGGTGGGGSFGAFVWNNGANGKMLDCNLNSNLPGNGGLGSLQAGLGGAGGAGNPVAVSQNCDLGNPGRGGNGGVGGNGGIGGNGTTGISLGLYEDPAGQALIQSSMGSAVEPIITVCELGCTYSEYTFSTNAFGFVQWFFDGGTVPLIATGNTVTANFTSQGRHTLTLVVNGLPYVYSEFVGIFEDGLPYLPNIVTADSVICPGQSANFQSSYAGIDYQWTFNGGIPPAINGPGNQNVASTFNAPGTYQVTIQSESVACGWSIKDSMMIEVLPTALPDVLVSTSGAQICNGENVTLGASPVNGGAAPQYVWFVNGVNTGSTGPVYNLNNVTANTTVFAQMTSNYVCPSANPVNSLPVNITVFPQPIVNCSSVGNYLGANTNFFPTPVGGSAPFTYFWDFGDGGVSTDSNAVHLYSGTGTYNVTVTATDAKGCVAVCNLVVNIIVAPLVNASFTLNAVSLCGSTAVTFQDQSTGSVVSWFWDFGDGTTSILQNPSHTYNSPGIYTVFLAASNGVNFDTTYMPNAIIVDPLPSAGIYIPTTSSCEDFSAQFQDASTGATSWQWNFGDPASGLADNSSLQNPLHIYYNPGVYTVTLIVTNSASGCSDTLVNTNYIRVFAAPDADFSVDLQDVCSGQGVQFTDLSTGNPSAWNWDFGDWNTSNLQNPLHIFPFGGLYGVTLEVTGPGPLFCKNTEYKPAFINVNQSPMADFSSNVNSIQLPENTVQFTNLSQNETSVFWNFDNGKTSSLQNPSTAFKDAGYYWVMIVAISGNGCRDTAYHEIEVLEQQVIYIPNSFTPDGDHVNDYFYVDGKGVKNFTMRIYDRWGNSVYTTNTFDGKWDGTFGNGKECEQGVYAFVINYQYYKGFEKVLHGSVLLLR